MKKTSFEFVHFYPNIDLNEFWKFFVDHEWYSKSEIMPGEILLEKSGENAPQGKGAVRKVNVNEKLQLVEDIVGYDPPNYFSYAPRDGDMPVKEYVGEFFYESKDGGMEWRYRGSFKPKPIGTNWLFKYLFRSRMKTMIPVWENGYKAYVER